MNPEARIQETLDKIMRLTLARANAEVALGDAATAVDQAQGAFDAATRRLNGLDAELREAQRALFDAVDDAGGGVHLVEGLGVVAPALDEWDQACREAEAQAREEHAAL